MEPQPQLMAAMEGMTASSGDRAQESAGRIGSVQVAWDRLIENTRREWPAGLLEPAGAADNDDDDGGGTDGRATDAEGGSNGNGSGGGDSACELPMAPRPPAAPAAAVLYRGLAELQTRYAGLTAEHVSHFRRRGYVRLPGVVPPAVCAAVRQELLKLALPAMGGKNPSEPADPHTLPPPGTTVRGAGAQLLALGSPPPARSCIVSCAVVERGLRTDRTCKTWRQLRSLLVPVVLVAAAAAAACGWDSLVI